LHWFREFGIDSILGPLVYIYYIHSSQAVQTCKDPQDVLPFSGQ
jgi:hypothetical protein